jgi:NAD(P)-dependent dehydrogenase (short-subunit alcohol dehydrogenase family)/acyl carrier protein
MRRSLELLRPFGRFVELGKRDVLENAEIGLSALERNATLHVVDLDPRAEQLTELLGRHLRTLLPRFEDGSLAPLPIERFEAEHAGEAFRRMSAARHIGKLVVTFDAETVQVESRGGLETSAAATHVVTGGLGALGLALARRLVTRGARQLALLGRGEPSADVNAAIADLEAQGASVRTFRVDVADRAALARCLATIRAQMPPIEGIYHGAGVLDDGTIASLDADRFARAMAPKVEGAWNLHELTRGDSLRSFVLFSSAAALLGSPGQANYCAANAFMDALAHHRQQSGLPALSVNWGPWAGVGLAAASPERGERLAARGVRSMEAEAALDTLELALAAGDPQLAALDFDVERWIEAAGGRRPALLRELASGSAPSRAGLRGGVAREISALHSTGEQREALELHVRAQVGDVLQIDAQDLELDYSLGDQGMDSLMAVELRNRLETSLGFELSTTLLFSHPTVRELVDGLLQRLVPLANAGARAADRAEDLRSILAVAEAGAAEDSRG